MFLDFVIVLIKAGVVLFALLNLAGILTSQGNCLYAATKHATVGLAEWLSITYHDRGIRSSLLAPLGVRTPMLGDVNSPFARLAAGPIKEPAEVAQMVVDAIREERFLIVTDPQALEWMEQKTLDTERWLRGMRRLQKRLEEEPALYSERWAGAFERQIVLDDDVDPDNVKATFKNGVLTVILAKKPEARRQVKRIQIS